MSLLKKTPPIIAGDAPYFLVFNGNNTTIDFGHPATLNNLMQAQPKTVEMWIYFNTSVVPPSGGYIYTFMSKYPPDGEGGFDLYYYNNPSHPEYYGITFGVFDTIYDGIAWKAPADPTRAQWLHCVGYMHTDKKVRVAVNGAWGDWSVGPVVEPVTDDSSIDLVFGKQSSFGYYFSGSFGWARFSDIDRYNGTLGTPFIPPLRNVTPTSDANTIFLIPMDDNSNTVRDISGNENNGLITGTYAWGRGYG